MKNTALGTNLKLAEMYWMIYKVFFISTFYNFYLAVLLTTTLKSGLLSETDSFNLFYDSEPQTNQGIKNFHNLSYNTQTTVLYYFTIFKIYMLSSIYMYLYLYAPLPDSSQSTNAACALVQTSLLLVVQLRHTLRLLLLSKTVWKPDAI